MKKKAKTAATLSIAGPGRMTARGRRDIAVWLRKHAALLLKYGPDYTEGRFNARFIYR